MPDDSDFFTEDENVPHIKPNIETELAPEKKKACRDIVQEIKNFGISQRQILFLIHLLSLELENREAMLQLTKTIGNIRNESLIPSDRGGPLLHIPKDGD